MIDEKLIILNINKIINQIKYRKYFINNLDKLDILIKKKKNT
ncbi:hypothetical protein [Candidatus Nardonella dryophthoridicola]|nr:hypothetical protein [Candidatus Nardonella dryophthoridicola]